MLNGAVVCSWVGTCCEVCSPVGTLCRGRGPVPIRTRIVGLKMRPKRCITNLARHLDEYPSTYANFLECKGPNAAQPKTFGLSDKPIIENARFKVTVESNASQESLRKLTKLAEERCPGMYSLTNKISVETELLTKWLNRPLCNTLCFGVDAAPKFWLVSTCGRCVGKDEENDHSRNSTCCDRQVEVKLTK
jgi:hypothetical protein